MKTLADKVRNIISVGNYSTTKTTKNGIQYNGISTIENVTNNNNEIVGLQSFHVGQDKHEEKLVYYFLDTGDVTSTHTSNSTHASHTSKITKATNNMFVAKGYGYSYKMNAAVKFKIIVKKNENNTGDMTSKIYIKDKDNNYKLQMKTIFKFNA